MLDPIIYVGNIFARYFRCFNQLSPTWEASGKLPTTTLTPSTVNDDFVCPKWSSKIWRQINLTRYLTYFNSKMPALHWPSIIDHVLSSHWRIHDLKLSDPRILHDQNIAIWFHHISSSIEVRNFSDHFSQVLWGTWLSIPTASALPASTQNRLSPVAGRLNVVETFRDFVTYVLWGPRPGSRSVGA